MNTLKESINESYIMRFSVDNKCFKNINVQKKRNSSKFKYCILILIKNLFSMTKYFIWVNPFYQMKRKHKNFSDYSSTMRLYRYNLQ